ncbi:MAG: O-antigen ligase family protein [Flavobacteriales bacterium]|jgi:O-antigen ligase|nr:O-antigen ligase family protein [Flavobacteriales bacterium]
MKALLKSIYPYLFLFFCFVLPLDKYATSVPNIVLIALVVIFPFVVTKENFNILKKREVLLFAGLVLYVFLNGFLFQDFDRDLTISKKIAGSLLLIVLAIPLERTDKLKKTVIVSVVICIAISLYHLYFFYMQEGEFNFAAGGEINEVLIIDRLYLGFLCVISIIASIGLIGRKYNEYNKWYFANIVLCAGFVLLISSRLAILLLVLLFLLKIFYTKSKKEYLFFFFGIVGLMIVAFMLNKNLNERFFYAHSTQKDKGYIELFQRMEPRVIIWECNYNIAKNEPFALTGLGFYHTKDLLVDCYREIVTPDRRKQYFIESRFNSHNQFMDFFLSTGIIGGLVFGLIFLSFFVRNWKYFFGTGLIVTMFAFANIESFFHRQLGAYYFGIVCIFLLMDYQRRNTDSEETKTGNQAE